MNLDVVKVLTDAHGKNIGYSVRHANGSMLLNKEGMFQAINGGHTFSNATVNESTSIIRVNKAVPREVAQKPNNVISALYPCKWGYPCMVLVKDGGYIKTVPASKFQVIQLMNVKPVFYDEMKSDIFSSSWFLKADNEESLNCLCDCIRQVLSADRIIELFNKARNSDKYASNRRGDFKKRVDYCIRFFNAVGITF